MNESTPTYYTEEQQANTDVMPVTVSFTLTVRHVGLLKQISLDTNTNKSELIRKMIEATYSNPTIIETKIA